MAKQYGIGLKQTLTFILWCVAYHQGPRYALQVANNYSESGGLSEMYSDIMANGVLGASVNRYINKKTLSAKDTSGVGRGTAVATAPGNNGSVGNNSQSVAVSGGKVIITADDSGMLTFAQSLAPM